MPITICRVRNCFLVFLMAVVAAAAGAAEDEPQPGVKDRPAQVDAQKQELYKRTVAAARASMSRRDVAAGKRNAKTAVKLAQSPEEEAETARLETLAQHLEEFWKVMGRVIAGLAPAQELILKETPIVVVETSATEIVFRIEGRNRTFPIKSLPREMVAALVQSGFADDTATKVLFGTFHAMDAQGDRREARRLWQELIEAGTDVSDLMPELSVTPDRKAILSQTPPRTPEKPETGRVDVPMDAAALQQAEKAVRTQFEIDYNLASSVNGKLKLSEKLADAAGSASLSAENRYVMLRDARDYALAAGKPGKACEVIDRAAKFFNMDALEAKTDAMERAAKTIRTSAGSKETAESALALVAQAVKAKRWNEAARLADVAVTGAQRVRNAALVQSAREAKLKVDQAAEKAGKGKKE